MAVQMHLESAGKSLTSASGWGCRKEYELSQNTRGTLLGVPILRAAIFWGLDWGPPVQGNYRIRVKADAAGVKGQENPSPAQHKTH